MNERYFMDMNDWKSDIPYYTKDVANEIIARHTHIIRKRGYFFTERKNEKLMLVDIVKHCSGKNYHMLFVSCKLDHVSDIYFLQ